VASDTMHNDEPLEYVILRSAATKNLVHSMRNRDPSLRSG
jgi:hypothetical protein